MLSVQKIFMFVFLAVVGMTKPSALVEKFRSQICLTKFRLNERRESRNFLRSQTGIHRVLVYVYAKVEPGRFFRTKINSRDVLRKLFRTRSNSKQVQESFFRTRMNVLDTAYACNIRKFRIL